MTGPGRILPPPNWRALFQAFWPIARRHRRLALGSAACRAASIALALVAPWPLKAIIDHGLSQRPLPASLSALTAGWSPLGLVVVLSASLVAIALLRALAEWEQATLSARWRERLGLEMRDRVLAHVQTLAPTLRATHRSGELVLRLVGDVDLFVRFQTRTLPTIAEHATTTLATLLMMFWLEPRLALLCLAMLPALVAIVRHYGVRLSAASREKRRREGEVAGLAQEIVRGLPVIQASGAEAHTRARFFELNSRSLAAGVGESRVAARMERTLRVAHGTTMGLLLAAGAILVLRGALTIGTLTVLASYLTQLLKPVERLNDLAENASKGAAGGERLLSLLRRAPAVAEAPDALSLERARGVIALRDVWFDYPGASRRGPVLRGVDLDLEPGTISVLMGPSGTGKSTLLNLIVRLFDPTAGTIALDGTPLNALALRSLRQQVALMSQDTHLFAGTMREAISPAGRVADDAAIWEALRLVALDAFVRALPAALDAPLGEDGVNLSGGQRQRLSLARAFLLDRPILLLDEPVAHVDAASEAVIAAALTRLRPARTILVVSHRLSLLDQADRVFHLIDGRIVEEPVAVARGADRRRFGRTT